METKKNAILFLVVSFLIIGAQLIKDIKEHSILLSLYKMIMILFIIIFIIHKNELIGGKYVQKKIEDYFK